MASRRTQRVRGKQVPLHGTYTEAHKQKNLNEKGREGKGREGKEREGKGRKGKGREGKGREGKGHHVNYKDNKNKNSLLPAHTNIRSRIYTYIHVRKNV